MADRAELPDQAQLEKLFRMLLGPEEETDEVAAEVALELYGIDPGSLSDDLRARIEREVEEMRARGEEVPPAMLQALKSLEPKTKDEDIEALNPEIWIDNLLRDAMTTSLTETGQAVHLQSFRARNMNSLSKEDQRILQELAEELKAETEGKEG